MGSLESNEYESVLLSLLQGSLGKREEEMKGILTKES